MFVDIPVIGELCEHFDNEEDDGTGNVILERPEHSQLAAPFKDHEKLTVTLSSSARRNMPTLRRERDIAQTE
jgi:hypothetical protein